MIIRRGVGLSKSFFGLLLALTYGAGCSGGSQGGRDAGANVDLAAQTGGRSASGGAGGSGGTTGSGGDVLSTGGAGIATGGGGAGADGTGTSSTGGGGGQAGAGGRVGAGAGGMGASAGYVGTAGVGGGAGIAGGGGRMGTDGSAGVGGGAGIASMGSGGRTGTGGAAGVGGAAGTTGIGGTGGTAGTTGTGGTAGSAGTGGRGGTGGTVSTCPAVSIGPLPVGAARSSGYAGNLTAYSALYNVTCTTLMNCADACVDAGGTRDSCTAGSECIQGTGQDKHCLPPTYWRYEQQALAESADYTGAAEQTLVVIAYNDPLVLTNFGVVVPAGSQIRGIQFDVSRSADALEATDDSIRILRNDQPVGIDRRRNDTWTANLGYVTYGGPSDTWGTTWTASDVQSNRFGIAVAARYTNTAGNARAYIDFARVTVTYVPPTCN